MNYFDFNHSLTLKHFQQTSLNSEDKNSLQNIESTENNIREIARNKLGNYAIDGEKLTRSDLNLFPIESFLPKASVTERNENNLMKNVRKKSRNNAMFNPFERRRINQWKYINDARVPEKQIKSVRKVKSFYLRLMYFNVLNT